MLSSVAENLYWMSRYIERADNLSRLVTAHQNELLDATTSMEGEGYDWHPLLEVTQMGDEDSDEGVVTYMVSSKENPDSIWNCVVHARENARTVRDQISEEMWVEINRLWIRLKEIDPNSQDRHSTMCDLVTRSCLQFRGIVSSILARTDVWAFTQLGQYIERADKTSRIVDLPHFLPEKATASAWNTMLRASSAVVEHQNRYGAEVDAASASTLLLFSSKFPRSVRFCVAQMNEMLHLISGTGFGDYLNEAERHTGSLLARLNFSGVEEIGKMGLHEYIDSLQSDLNQIGHELGMRYFLLRRDSPPSSAEAYVTSRMQAQVEQQQQ